MNVTKTGIFQISTFQENGSSNANIFPGFKNYFPDATGKYTINSTVTDSTFGSGTSIIYGKVIVPYGSLYRISMDIYVPTTHKIQIDINNNVPNGTAWHGNDNDLSSTRTTTNFTIPATTWTTITWGSSNLHSLNTKQEDICVYDNIGLVTKDDTAAVTWYIKNVSLQIGYNTNQLFSIYESKVLANDFIEI